MLFRLILVAVIGFMLYRFLRGVALVNRKAPRPPRPRPPKGFDFDEREVTDVSFAESEPKRNGQ